MADNIYIDGTTNGNGAAAADWSLGWRPIAGDVALFTTAGVGVANNCVFDAPMTCDGLVLAADYGGDVDLVTHNFTLEVSGCTLDGGGTFDMGTGTMTVQVVFDNQHQTTFDDGTSVIQFTGNGNWISATSRDIYKMVIDVGVTVSVPAGSGLCYVADRLTVNGELAIANGETVFARNGVVVNSTGSVTGLGTLRMNNPTAGDGITTMDGVITCAELQWFQGSATSVLAIGTYAPTLFRMRYSAGGTGICRLLSGTYNFNCIVEVENSGAGSMTFDCSTNSPTVNISGNILNDEQAGTVAWTGSITLTGANNQSVTMDGVASQPNIEINKSGGVVTFVDGWSGAVFLGTDGSFDPNGQTLAASGNFTTLAGFTAAVAADVMNGCSILVGGNLSLTASAGDPLELLATVAWVLSVTGTTFAHYVEAEYSNAAGGTEIDASDGTNTDGGNNFNWLWDVSSSSSSSQSSMSSSSMSSSSQSSTSSSSLLKVPDMPGMEFSLPINRLHFTVPAE